MTEILTKQDIRNKMKELALQYAKLDSEEKANTPKNIFLLLVKIWAVKNWSI